MGKIRCTLTSYFECKKGLQTPPSTCTLQNLQTSNLMPLQVSREVTL